jgi:hypothetical protein
MGLLGLICAYLLVGLLMDLRLEHHLHKAGRPHGWSHVVAVAMLWLPMLVWYGFYGRHS